MSEIFQISDLLAGTEDKRRYREFLRAPAVSAGVYVLGASAIDSQTPHREDEIYYVVRGRAKIRLGSKEQAVRQGDIIFVEALLEHRFFEITDELVLLVIFAPAESA